MIAAVRVRLGRDRLRAALARIVRDRAAAEAGERLGEGFGAAEEGPEPRDFGAAPEALLTKS